MFSYAPLIEWVMWIAVIVVIVLAGLVAVLDRE